MVSVNRSLRYFMLLSSAFALAGSFGSAAFAADADILPPPPPDEDTAPAPHSYDPSKYVQTYGTKRVTTTTTVRPSVVGVPGAPQVVTTGTMPNAIVPQAVPTAGPTATTTTTIQAVPLTPPSVTTTTATTATTVTRQQPTNAAAQVLLNKAYAAMRKNDFNGAVKLLNDAARADANSTIVRRYLAYALIRVARPGEALSQLVVLSNMLRPNQPSTFDQFNYGEAYLTLRNFPAAEESFKKVLAAEPKNDAARGGLIKAYAYNQKFPDAISQVQAGQQNPRMRDYYRGLLELVYNIKTATTVGSAPNMIQSPDSSTWQQISPR